MLSIVSDRSFRDCAGINRRGFLKIGTLGAGALARRVARGADRGVPAGAADRAGRPGDAVDRAGSGAGAGAADLAETLETRIANSVPYVVSMMSWFINSE